MPSDTASTTKRRNTGSASPSAIDHRKRRRNRMTVSCTQCHATKRMCDRKRPCSRCTQLGLTGLCVYEVDDPARQSDAQDGSSRLLNRIAELEGVIRELKDKNKRSDARETTSLILDSPLAAPTSPLKSPSYADVPFHNLTSFGEMAWSNLLNWDSSGSSDSSCSRSPLSTPSPLLVSASRSPQPLPPCHGSPWTQNVQIARKPDPDCTCMTEPACHNIAVELASDLRRAATVLSRSCNHCFGSSSCTLSTKICELELFTDALLRNARVPGDGLEVTGLFNGAYRTSAGVRVGEQQVKFQRDSFWDENGLPAYDDSFMSWIPATPFQKHAC
ncbi:hypothetical protein C8R43DRAFT_460754 [Mycena crocata]|nr:hypothetical protein C8R43DRAFT_460754 [Mycena crocata]